MKVNIAEINKLAGEIERRHIFGVAFYYLVAVATLSALAADLLPPFGISDWVVRITILGLFFVGFPVALALAWIFELGPEGVRIDSGDDSERDTEFRLSEREAYLVVTLEQNGKFERRKFKNSFTVGRSQKADVSINDLSVSRKHARIYLNNGSWVLEDLGSLNGTKLNGEQVSRVNLPPYAELDLGPNVPLITIRTIESAKDRTHLVAVPDSAVCS